MPIWTPRDHAPLMIHPQVRILHPRGVPVGGAGRGPNLLVNGMCESLIGWTVVNGTATLEGGQVEGAACIRITRTGAASAHIYQAPLTVGHDYRLTGWARGDGAVKPRVYCGGTFWTGTTAHNWQVIDVAFMAASNTIRFYELYGAAGNYVEWDGLYLSEE